MYTTERPIVSTASSTLTPPKKGRERRVQIAPELLTNNGRLIYGGKVYSAYAPPKIAENSEGSSTVVIVLQIYVTFLVGANGKQSRILDPDKSIRDEEGIWTQHLMRLNRSNVQFNSNPEFKNRVTSAAITYGKKGTRSVLMEMSDGYPATVYASSSLRVRSDKYGREYRRIVMGNPNPSRLWYEYSKEPKPYLLCPEEYQDTVDAMSKTIK